jgi:hypothetical protein
LGAKGDGKTDDTLAFQKALDQAGEKGGIVLVPQGQYRLNGIISVPEGVTLEGFGVARIPLSLTKDRRYLLMQAAIRKIRNHLSVSRPAVLWKELPSFILSKMLLIFTPILGQFKVKGRTTISSMLLLRTHSTGLIAEPSTMKGITSEMSLCVL